MLQLDQWGNFFEATHRPLRGVSPLSTWGDCFSVVPPCRIRGELSVASANHAVIQPVPFCFLSDVSWGPKLSDTPGAVGRKVARSQPPATMDFFNPLTSLAHYNRYNNKLLPLVSPLRACHSLVCGPRAAATLATLFLPWKEKSDLKPMALWWPCKHGVKY